MTEAPTDHTSEYDSYPTAQYRGVLPLNGVDIPCFVLDDGRRVISGRGMSKSIGMKGRGPGFSRIASTRSLKLFIPEDLRLAIEEPIRFRGSTSRKSTPTTGFEATILVELCEAILVARDAGALSSEADIRYAQYADLLLRSFAKIGIIALVDEATGYQVDREKEALQNILAVYIAPELMPWTRRFPHEFYRELFRLRGWKYNPNKVTGPRFAGKLTNKLIYEKLPKGVLEELKIRDPVRQSGSRKNKFHQHLSENVGDKHLDKQIAVVLTLMRISPNWRTFERHFERAFPEAGYQIPLDLAGDE